MEFSETVPISKTGPTLGSSPAGRGRSPENCCGLRNRLGFESLCFRKFQISFKYNFRGSIVSASSKHYRPFGIRR